MEQKAQEHGWKGLRATFAALGASAAVTGLLCVTATSWAHEPGSPRNYICLCFGGMSYVDEDIDATYGTTMVNGVRWTAAISENSDFFVGIHRGSDSGDPYYTADDFSSADAARLTVVPIEFGARLYTSRHPATKFFMGIGVDYLWLRESIPGTDPSGVEEKPACSGWGWGMRFMGGPEWRFSRGRFVLGAEFSYAFRRVQPQSGTLERIVDLTGLTARGYFGFAP